MSSTTARDPVDLSWPQSAASADDECRSPAGADDCCSLATGPIEADDAERLSARLKALSDPTRLQLLSHVAAGGCQSVCVCDLGEGLGISQPTVSHHMKKLVEAGLLTREQRGRWAHYAVVPSAFAELRAFLDLS
ncbi:ArsR/SmtB family transcription factor [Brachybacterium sp. GCM10030267]|uniref:ArsR/SmtB family transcription factor n=1 Tax=unclassified Brachybacterium TaxID=2623841 RepID=UPI00360FB6A8